MQNSNRIVESGLKMIMLDKRKTERYALSLSAFLTSHSIPGNGKVQHVTRDISASGAFFHSHRPIPVGTEVKVDLVMPNRVHIKVDGAVVRSSLNGMAVSFDNKYEIVPSRS